MLTYRLWVYRAWTEIRISIYQMGTETLSSIIQFAEIEIVLRSNVKEAISVIGS